MSKLSIKTLTFDNWLKPNNFVSNYGKEELDGSFKAKTAQEWFDDFFELKLSDKVPDEIKDQFEVARSTMTYGYFYYPIYTLVMEQFSRIFETAINIRCHYFYLPDSNIDLYEKLDWLSEKLKFNKEEISRLKSIRVLRNKWSHPERQNILGPGEAIGFMNTTANVINNLF